MQTLSQFNDVSYFERSATMVYARYCAYYRSTRNGLGKRKRIAMDITELLAFSAKQGASDLHLSAGLPPMIRVDGDVRRINLPPLDSPLE